MSASDKPDLARGARHAEALIDEEVDRVVAMSDADFERAMDSLPPPSRVPSVDDLLARAQEKARAQQAPGRTAPARLRRSRWAIALAAAAVVALALAIEHRQVMAWLHGPDAPLIIPDPSRAPTPHEEAEALRAKATEACASQLWGRCITQLDTAKSLDPAGEATPQVQSLRAAISSHTQATPDPKRPPDSPK
jgi:hypothetical protein